MGSWTGYGSDYEIFSGSAEYSINIPAFQNTDADAWELNLGDVRESAAIYFNDEYIGTVFKKPYSVRLNKEQLSKGGELRIRVSSSMENRIRHMDRNKIVWRNLYNANIAARTPQSRGSDGFFSAERWDVEDSGLIGPITLTELEAI